MNILKNKHMITAALVAPVLALIGYFSLDFFMGESPQAAEPGQSYQLVEKPNCRYNSGICGLKNGDFELTLNTERIDDERQLLMLKSAFPLDGVKVALFENKADAGESDASESDEQRPVDMQPISDDGLVWSLDMRQPDPEHDRLRLVAASNQSLYYGDVALKFMLWESTVK